ALCRGRPCGCRDRYAAMCGTGRSCAPRIVESSFLCSLIDAVWFSPRAGRGLRPAMSAEPEVRLDLFSARDFDRGRSVYIEAVWLALDALLVRSWLPGSQWRIFLLKAFGAQIGPGVRIKQRVR